MEVFIGTVCAFGFNYAPYGWLLCQGQILSIQSNTALFSLLGTAYGGNGTNNFGLPNLQGRVANGLGSNSQSNYVMGEIGGNDTVTVLSSNMPGHSHAVAFSLNGYTSRSVVANSSNPGGCFPASSVGNQNDFNTVASASSNMKAPTVTLGNAGGSTPISVQDPALVLNYSICLNGLYPSRN